MGFGGRIRDMSEIQPIRRQYGTVERLCGLPSALPSAAKSVIGGGASSL